MAIQNPVTTCGVNSSGDSEAIRVVSGAANVASGITGSQVTPRDAADSANQTLVAFAQAVVTIGYCRVVINGTDAAAATALRTGVGALHYKPGEIISLFSNIDITDVYSIAFGAAAVTAGTGLVGTDDNEITISTNQVRWRFTGSESVRHVNVGCMIDAYAAASLGGLFVEGFEA